MADVSVAEVLEHQARQCEQVGSSLYKAILLGALADLKDGGITAEVLAGREGDPFGSVLGLRLLGVVHRIVLEGRAPALAECYPSAGGTVAAEHAPERFLAALREHRDEVVRRLGDGVQTNEVGRCATLVGGFATVARRTGLPLRVLEIGSSAGLNLRFDAYEYDPSWWEGERPSLPGEFQVVERRGCDPSPIDPTTHDGQLQLRSFVWPDQMARHQRLEAAFAVAARVPAVVDQADGLLWVADRLAEPSDGVATVVFHSIVLQYLSREQRAEVPRVMAAAGRRATPAAPLAWLRMEPGGDVAELRLTMWPEGREELLATSGYHGPPVRWLSSR